jgi:glycosyltransferase involved in cell wall biosynthesis
MKTIGILCSDFEPPWRNGRAIHVCALVNGLSRNGHRFAILARGERAGCVVHNDRTTVYYVRRTPAAPSPEEVASEALAAFAQNGLTTDLLHCHDPLSFQAAHVLKQRLSVPLVTTVHYLAEPFHRRLGNPAPEDMKANERDMCTQSDALIAISHSLARTIADFHAVDSKKVSVIFNGIEPIASFHVRPASPMLARLRERLGLTSEKIILFVGRFEPLKGVSALLRSAMRVTADRPDVVYLFAGDRYRGPFTEQCELLIATHPRLKTRVRLLGRQERGELRLLYALADVVVVPSVYDGPAYTALEAMTSGIATIASDTGGLPELVEHERSGLLVPLVEIGNGLWDVDVPKLADAQLRLVNDATLAARLGAAGRLRVLEHFRYDTMLQRTADLYASLM